MNAGEELMWTLMKERGEADRLKREVAHLEGTVEAIAQGEEILGDVEPAVYAAGALVALKMIRGQS